MGSVHALRDRNYYRMMPDGQLIELARASNDDLLLVMSERLEELEAAERTVAELSQEVNDLEERMSLWQDDALRLQQEVDELTLRIANLEDARGSNE